MDHPSFDVLRFLGEPGRPASVATVTGQGHPALAMMWFSVAEDRLWFHTPGGGDIPLAVPASRGRPPGCCGDDRDIRPVG